MAKGNPLLLKRKPQDLVTRVLVSRSTKNQDESWMEFPITLRRLTGLDVLTGLDKGNELAARFVWGGELLPPVDGQAVIVSHSACVVVGTLLTAQSGPQEDRYNEFEFFAMMTDDEPGWDTETVKVGDEEVTRPVRLPSLFEQLYDLKDELSPTEEAPANDPLAKGAGQSSSTPP